MNTGLQQTKAPLQTILAHSVICGGQGNSQPLLDNIQNVWSVPSPLVSMELGPLLVLLMVAIPKVYPKALTSEIIGAC